MPQHRADRTPRHRRALERAGWRTLLEYRENHVRGDDGVLIAVEAQWIAEAERPDDDRPEDEHTVASVCASTPDEAWARLRRCVRVA